MKNRGGMKVRVLQPVDDPAGLDKLLLAAAHSGIRYLEQFATSRGVTVDLWSGPNGAGAVLEQAIRERGVPNKRFAELVNPRTIAEGVGLVKKPRKRRAIR
jgi:hypothetical protein